ncbi:glycosyltransferase family 39 protein [Albidovulum sp.]
MSTAEPESRRLLAGTLAVVAAPLLIALAVLSPAVLPGIGPFQPLDRWAVSVLAVACLVLGFALRRGAAEFGGFAFIFILGGGAQLYMTQPLWFPSLRLRPEGARDWLMVLIMAAEIATAGIALARIGAGRLIAIGRERLGSGRIAIFLALSFAFAVPVIPYIWRGAALAYAAHVAAAAVLLATHLALLIAMSQVRSPISGLHRLTPIVPALFVTAASLILGALAFQHMPHVEDEVAYIFQARTFAGGALTVPAPPPAAAPGLDYYLFEIRDGRWYAATQPGWPAALALGYLAGLPWLLNPLLAGFSVLMAHSITRRRIGLEAADLVALMMATSPWILAASASFMPHMLTLFLILLSWWLILRARPAERPEWRRLFLAGMAMGWVFATRPLDGVLIGGLTGLWVLFGPQGSLRRALIYAAGCVAVGGLLLLYNHLITGSPLTLPLSAYLDRHWAPGANAFGFGKDIGPPGGWVMLDLWPGHSPLEALINTIHLAVSLQFEFLGWPVGSLMLLFAFLLWQRKTGFDGAMMAVIATVVGTMALYWFAASYYIGPRYWFPAAFAFLCLSARGYQALRGIFPGTNEQGIVRIDTILGTCCLFGLLIFTPWRGVVKYHEYGGFHAYVREAAAAGQFGNAVVLVEKNGDPGSALVLNDPWLRADRPVFLDATADLDEAALRAAFPGREIIRYMAPRRDLAAPPQ